MQYPNEHRQIVKELLSGKFIVDDSPLFDEVRKEEVFYTTFFEQTYGYHLQQGTNEFYYLTSEETTENNSRDFALFLSVLCYEYQNRGKNITKEIDEVTFLVQKVTDYIEKSSHKELLRKTQVMDSKKQELDVPSFLKQWGKRHLLEYIDTERTQFKFKKPIRLFLDFAFELYKENLKEDKDTNTPL